MAYTITIDKKPNLVNIIFVGRTAELLKKLVFLWVFYGIIGGLYALDFSLSAGGGPLLGYTFTRYTLEGADSGGGEPVKSVQRMDRFDYGGFIFLDGTYAELSLSLQNGLGGYQETTDYNSSGLTDDNGRGYETFFGISLAGKYPFVLNEKWTVFPAAGVEYLIALIERRQPEGDKVYDRPKGELAADTDKNGDSYPLAAWNSLLIKIGAGADYTLTRLLFLRGELLYSFRLQTPYETGALEMVKHQFNIPSPKFYGLTSGPSLRIALGYRCF
jgi:hypothetical protein